MTAITEEFLPRQAIQQWIHDDGTILHACFLFRLTSPPDTSISNWTPQRVLAELLLKYTLICACFLCFSLAARGRTSVMSLPLDNARKCLLSKRADKNTQLLLPIAGAVSLFTIVPVKRIWLKKSYIFLQKDI